MSNCEHLKMHHAAWSLCSEMVRVALEEKEYSDIEEVFGKRKSEHPEPLIELIKERLVKSHD